jgi:hypothetical protein
LRWRNGFGPAPNPAQFLLDMQCRDIAPDRGFGCAGQRDQIDYGHDGSPFDGRQYDPVAFAFVHLTLHQRRVPKESITVNHFRSRYTFLRCSMTEVDRS